MTNKIALKMFLFIALTITLYGCSATKADENPQNILKADSIYIGVNATKEIIEVDSDNTWTIKSENEDDTNFTVVSVEETGEKIGEFPVVELVAKEVNGDIESSFAKREGRMFIVVNDEDGVFFRSIADENRDSITADLEKTDDPTAHIKDIANFKFAKH